MKEKVIKIDPSDFLVDFLRWFKNRVGRIKSDSKYEAMFDTCHLDNKIRVFVDVPFSCWNYFGTSTLQRFSDVSSPKYVLIRFMVDIPKGFIRFYFERKNAVLSSDVQVTITDIGLTDDLPF